jgi:hypothetical protein
VAVSSLKLSQRTSGTRRIACIRDALEALNAVPVGPWWERIYEDPELEGLRGYPQFSALWQRRSGLYRPLPAQHPR